MGKHFNWEYKDLKPALKRVWKELINEYFEGNKDNWRGRKEPYVFYKHLFRQFCWQHLEIKEHIRDIEEELSSRPNHQTVYNSLQQNPQTFKLTDRQLTEIVKFFNKHLYVNRLARLKNLIYKWKDRGYTTSDIARQCVVRESTIHNILNNVEPPHNIVKQIEKELNDKT